MYAKFSTREERSFDLILIPVANTSTGNAQVTTSVVYHYDCIVASVSEPDYD